MTRRHGCIITSLMLLLALPVQEALATPEQALKDADLQPSSELWFLVGLIIALGLWWRYERRKMRARSRDHRSSHASSRDGHARLPSPISASPNRNESASD